MRTRQLMLFLILTACCVMNSCSQKNNPTAKESKVKSTIDDFKRFWETKDTTVLTRIMAHDADMVNFGTDANEIFAGWNALKDSVQQLLPLIDKVKINVRSQVIKVGPSAEVAWFSEIWDWDFVFGEQPVKQSNLRLTGVLEKRNGNWIIVQFHNSAPVTP